MATGRFPAFPATRFFASGPPRPGRRGMAGRLSAALLWAAVLPGCGTATLDLARSETEDTARQVSALRLGTAPRFSAIRVIERRPMSG